MSTPTVTIVMRTKNRPLFLKRAIDSALKQTFSHWHLAIVNDGGNQSEVEAITSLFKNDLKGRLTLCHHPKSKGMAAASNTALQATQSEYIALLDDDDTWEPSFLELSLQFLTGKGSSIGGVASYTNAILERISQNNIFIKSKVPYPLQPKLITLTNLLLANQFTNLSFVYRRKIGNAIGNYDENLLLFDDWDFNLRFAKEAQIGVLPQFLANYHFRTDTSLEKKESNNSLGLRQDKEHDLAYFRDYQLKKDLKNGSIGIGSMMHFSYLQLQELPKKLSLCRALKHDVLWLSAKCKEKIKTFCARS